MDRKKDHSTTPSYKNSEEARRAEERENLKAKINYLQLSLNQKQHENQRLLEASKELNESNQALTASNSKLIEANVELNTANQKLVEANKKLIDHLSPEDSDKPKKN